MHLTTFALGTLAFVGAAVNHSGTSAPCEGPTCASLPSRTVFNPVSSSEATLTRTINDVNRRGDTTVFLPAPTTPTSCNSGSTLRTGEGFFRDCNYLSRLPGHGLDCSATVASYIDCYAIQTTTRCPSWSCQDFGGSRSQRLVNKHAATATVNTEARTTNDMGGRSNWWDVRKAAATSNYSGGRSQRYVAQEAVATSNNLGGRSQRYVARVAPFTIESDIFSDLPLPTACFSFSSLPTIVMPTSTTTVDRPYSKQPIAKSSDSKDMNDLPLPTGRKSFSTVPSRTAPVPTTSEDRPYSKQPISKASGSMTTVAKA